MNQVIKQSICNACSGSCGVLVTSKGKEHSLSGDPNCPISVGYSCERGEESLRFSNGDERILRPLKRLDSGLQEITWEQAYKEIGEKLKSSIKRNGTDSFGVLAGTPLGSNHTAAIGAACLAIGVGSPHLFSNLSAHGGPLLVAAEKMLGWPTALQSDPGRAHVTVLLGDCQQDTEGWGPLQRGRVHLQAMRHIQRSRRSAKLFTVGSQSTKLSEEANQHISINPGTEVFFLLGMCNLIVSSQWTDDQYVHDYCVNYDKAQAWLEPWTPQVVAEICGVTTQEISGVTLAFSRAPMACVIRSQALLRGPHPTVAAWAWHLIHALTANLLRPGGAYEAVGPIDLHPLMSSFPSEQAPKSSNSGAMKTLLQTPATSIAGTDLSSMIIVGSDPVASLPGPDSIANKLSELDTLVCIEHQHTETTAYAHYILPATTMWERDSYRLFDGPLLPFAAININPKATDKKGDQRDDGEIIRQLFGVLPKAWRSNPWGTHLWLLAKWLQKGNVSKATDRIIKWVTETDAQSLLERPNGLEKGECNRARRRLNTENEKIDLAPIDFVDGINRVSVPAPEEGQLFAVTTSKNDGDYIGLHPDLKFKAGSKVTVSTAHGEITGLVRLDETLHSRAVQISWNNSLKVNRLTSHTCTDDISGAAVLTGFPCSVSKPTRKRRSKGKS
jgi:anaerobic selenocysteine-containing dehydrogenase